jgi:hypothetical protein
MTKHVACRKELGLSYDDTWIDKKTMEVRKDLESLVAQRRQVFNQQNKMQALNVVSGATSNVMSSLSDCVRHIYSSDEFPQGTEPSLGMDTGAARLPRSRLFDPSKTPGGTRERVERIYYDDQHVDEEVDGYCDIEEAYEDGDIKDVAINSASEHVYTNSLMIDGSVNSAAARIRRKNNIPHNRVTAAGSAAAGTRDTALSGNRSDRRMMVSKNTVRKKIFGTAAVGVISTVGDTARETLSSDENQQKGEAESAVGTATQSTLPHCNYTFDHSKTPVGTRDRIETIHSATKASLGDTYNDQPTFAERTEEEVPTPIDFIGSGTMDQHQNRSILKASPKKPSEHSPSLSSASFGLGLGGSDPYSTPAPKGTRSVKFTAAVPSHRLSLASKDPNVRPRSPSNLSPSSKIRFSPTTSLSTRMSLSPATSATNGHFLIAHEKGPGIAEILHLPGDVHIKPTGPTGPKAFMDSICMLSDGSVVGVLEGPVEASDCWKVLVYNISNNRKPIVGPFDPKGPLPVSTTGTILAIQSVGNTFCVMMKNSIQLYDYDKGHFKGCREIPVKEGIRTELSPRGIFVSLGKSGLFSLDPEDGKIKVWTENKHENEKGTFTNIVGLPHYHDGAASTLVPGGLNQEMILSNGNTNPKRRLHYVKRNGDGTHEVTAVSKMIFCFLSFSSIFAVH